MFWNFTNLRVLTGKLIRLSVGLKPTKHVLAITVLFIETSDLVRDFFCAFEKRLIDDNGVSTNISLTSL